MEAQLRDGAVQRCSKGYQSGALRRLFAEAEACMQRLSWNLACSFRKRSEVSACLGSSDPALSPFLAGLALTDIRARTYVDAASPFSNLGLECFAADAAVLLLGPGNLPLARRSLPCAWSGNGNVPCSSR